MPVFAIMQFETLKCRARSCLFDKNLRTLIPFFLINVCFESEKKTLMCKTKKCKFNLAEIKIFLNFICVEI